MKYLLTPTLLNSWAWMFQAPEGWQESALSDFLKTLNREPIPDNQAMKAGREFESAVNWFLESGESEKSDLPLCIKEAAEIVRGGVPQVSGYCDIELEEITFLLYGRADYLRGAHIYDLKNVSNYETGKYFKSFQHGVYFKIFPGTLYFEYVINHKGSIYRERYSRDSTDEYFPIIGGIEEFYNWLKSNPEYLKIYLDRWPALGNKKKGGSNA